MSSSLELLRVLVHVADTIEKVNATSLEFVMEGRVPILYSIVEYCTKDNSAVMRWKLCLDQSSDDLILHQSKGIMGNSAPMKTQHDAQLRIESLLLVLIQTDSIDNSILVSMKDYEIIDARDEIDAVEWSRLNPWQRHEIQPKSDVGLDVGGDTFE